MRLFHDLEMRGLELEPDRAPSFGTDVAAYDRTRPAYPQDFVDAVVAASPGSNFLDVGIGNGVSSLPFQAAGCRVLGVEVDPQMAEFARAQYGFDVEVAEFEDWDPAGRTFDTVIAGGSWHWVDPVVGAAKAAAALRPGGRFAAFWNVGKPPAELAGAFDDVYRRVVPDTDFAEGSGDPVVAFEPFVARTADGLEQVDGFDTPERQRFDWQQHYTKDEWLECVPTFLRHRQLPPGKLDQILAGLGDAIDGAGGDFTAQYTVIVVTAGRR